MTDPDPSHGCASLSLSAVPLFPLPNVVLFPRAVLPLHVFEERYKTRTAHALAGDHLVAMALLKPGWERDYYSRPAIEPVVCVGRIVSSERLPDGKYNFLLQGQCRARVVRERAGYEEPYRVAELARLDDEPAVMEIDLADDRGRIARLFERGPLARTPVGRQFNRLVGGPLPTADLADLIAFTFLEDVWLKQSLLAEPDARRRVPRVLDALDALQPVVQHAHQQVAGDPSLN
jgi:Lon protease-like protein